jgi:ribonucleoside-diphosphate reductase beta chain
MIFDKRIAYKPFEYADVMQYVKLINNTYWVHDEVDFSADIQHFKTELKPYEQNAVKRTALVISQIEVNVKTLWGDLYKMFPKPEFNNLGVTFAECETRHSEAYSRLLEVLGFNNEFNDLINVPVIKERIDYLTKALANTKSDNKEDYVFSLILFSILIENVSLFSQFAILLSFTRFKGLMKNVSNIIAWTSKDEEVHAQGGIYIINKIKEEYPDLLAKDRDDKIYEMIKHSIEVESKILDWIFEDGELDIISKQDLLYFMQYRVDNSLEAIGLNKLYNVSKEQIKPMLWFEEETMANTLTDFFAKRPVDYTKHNRPYTSNDLF